MLANSGSRLQRGGVQSKPETEDFSQVPAILIGCVVVLAAIYLLFLYAWTTG